MGRTLAGIVLAAVAMFAIGFGFYATPLGETAVYQASDSAGATVQAALRKLPADGFYAIPNPTTKAGEAGFARGPVAFVHVRLGGRPVFEPLTLVKGLIHYLVVATLLALVLGGVAQTARTRVVLGVAAIAVVFVHLGGPIWWGFTLNFALFVALADFVSLAIGGLIVARFVPAQHKTSQYS